MIPGAPAVMPVSVTDSRCTPFSMSEIVEPNRPDLQLRTRRQHPRTVNPAQLRPVTRGPLEQHQLRIAVIPEVQGRVPGLPVGLRPHHRRDPMTTRQLRRRQRDLRELVTAERQPAHVSPVSPPLDVPTTTCEEIASPPLLTAVQFDPRPPSARLKSSAAVVAARAGCDRLENHEQQTARKQQHKRAEEFRSAIRQHSLGHAPHPPLHHLHVSPAPSARPGHGPGGLLRLGVAEDEKHSGWGRAEDLRDRVFIEGTVIGHVPEVPNGRACAFDVHEGRTPACLQVVCVERCGSRCCTGPVRRC